MQVDDAAYHQLVATALRRAKDAPTVERIKIYALLAKAAPTEAQRSLAERVSVSLSAAAAAQLEFEKLFPAPRQDGHGDGNGGDGHHS